MKSTLFLGKRVFHSLEANDGIQKLEQAVVSSIENLFPGGIDKDEYSQMTAIGSVDNILNFKLEVVIDERAGHEITHSDSFDPALTIVREFGQILENFIGNIVDSLTLIVVVKVELVRKNRVYDTLHYKRRAVYENGLVTILQENMGAPS